MGRPPFYGLFLRVIVAAFEPSIEVFERDVSRRASLESQVVLRDCSTIKTATVRELRNHYSRLRAWIAAGEEIIITQHGKPVARLSPTPAPSDFAKADWNRSAAVARDRSREICWSAEESSEFRKEKGHRAFDILHVAVVLLMRADRFLTFDTNQKKLAESEGLLVPF